MKHETIPRIPYSIEIVKSIVQTGLIIKRNKACNLGDNIR